MKFDGECSYLLGHESRFRNRCLFVWWISEIFGENLSQCRFIFRLLQEITSSHILFRGFRIKELKIVEIEEKEPIS